MMSDETQINVGSHEDYFYLSSSFEATFPQEIFHIEPNGALRFTRPEPGQEKTSYILDTALLDAIAPHLQRIQGEVQRECIEDVLLALERYVQHCHEKKE